MLRGPFAAGRAAPQAETEQQQCERSGPIADQAANAPQVRQEKSHSSQPAVEQRDGAMAVAGDDQASA